MQQFEEMTMARCLRDCQFIEDPCVENVFRVLFPGWEFGEFLNLERRREWERVFEDYSFDEIMEHKQKQCRLRASRLNMQGRQHAAELPISVDNEEKGWFDWFSMFRKTTPNWIQNTHADLNSLATAQLDVDLPNIMKLTMTNSYEHFIEYFLTFGKNSANMVDLLTIVKVLKVKRGRQY